MISGLALHMSGQEIDLGCSKAGAHWHVHRRKLGQHQVARVSGGRSNI